MECTRTTDQYEDWRRWRTDGWLPCDALPPAPEELITSDQLLAKMERLGPAVNRRTLRNWEHAGVLPAPIRRRWGGATRGLYPRWTVDLIWILMRHRDAGLRLADLPDLMRAEAHALARHPFRKIRR